LETCPILKRKQSWRSRSEEEEGKKGRVHESHYRVGFLVGTRIRDTKILFITAVTQYKTPLMV